MTGEIRIKRAYDAPAKVDGFRVLVDRIWPRGVSKDELRLDRWAKEIAPTTKLRQWFGHDPDRWAEFRARYQAELRDPECRRKIREIVASAKGAPVITLVYSAKDEEHNQAVVLRGVLSRLLKRSAS